MMRCHQYTCAFLCFLNPKFSKHDILSYLAILSILETNRKGWGKHSRFKRRTTVYLRERDLMDIWVRKESIGWHNLSFEKIDHVLDIPHLGILGDQLLNYFITRDLSILTRCIEDVKKNPEPFIIKRDIDLNPTKIEFEWHGKSTIETCRSLTHINYKRVNIQGLRVLRNACIFEILTATHDGVKSKELYLINQIKNSIIWDDLCYLVILYVNEDADKLSDSLFTPEDSCDDIFEIENDNSSLGEIGKHGRLKICCSFGLPVQVRQRV